MKLYRKQKESDLLGQANFSLISWGLDEGFMDTSSFML